MATSTSIVKSFLGFNLRTGCLIFGYTQLAVLIIVSIGAIVTHSSLDNIMRSIMGVQAHIQSNFPMMDDKLLDGVNYELFSAVATWIQRIRSIIVTVIVILAKMDILTVTLLVGLHMNSRALVKVFLVYSGVSLLLSLLLFTFVLVPLTIGSAFEFFKVGILDVVVGGVTCGLPQVWFFLLLSSHYHDMGGQRPAQAIC